MYRGEVCCRCGQLFGFETIREVVRCPGCGQAFKAAEHCYPADSEPGSAQTE